jgi:hypothetical protein
VFNDPMFGVSIALSTVLDQNNINVMWSWEHLDAWDTYFDLAFPNEFAWRGPSYECGPWGDPLRDYHLKRMEAGWLGVVVVAFLL